MKTLIPRNAVLVGVALSLAAVTASEWDPAGSGLWADASRWVGGEVPGKDAEIVINNCTGLVTAADAALFAQAKSITVNGTAGCLVISNDASEAKLVSSAQFPPADGAILKLGSGTVNLTYTNTVKETETLHLTGGIDIRDGVFSLRNAMGYGAPNAWAKYLRMNKVSVWKPGIFEGTQLTSMKIDGGLYGSGIVTNDTKDQSSNRTIEIFGSTDPLHPAVFSGDFVDRAYFCSNGNNCYQHLTGSNSTAIVGMLQYANGGELGVATFGKSGGPSSWGNTMVQWRGSNNHLTYLGTGETTDREFYYGNSGRLPELDAGVHGGLKLTGRWSMKTNEVNYMNGLDLSGNGTNVFGGSFTSTCNKDGRPAAVYIRKKGDGTWRFTAGKTRENRGVVETQRGELQFESIAERGEACSLGDATVLHQRYCNQIDDTKAVPYAYLLGDGATDAADARVATMNYVGAESATVTTRPIALNGAGRIKSETAPLYWRGITASGAGAHTLVLGESASGSGVGGVTNGPGTVGITKTGDSTWTVGNDSTFTGPIDIKGGILNLSGANYEWYRLTLMGSWRDATNKEGVVIGTLSGEDGSKIALYQWALLDDAGVNQVVNIPHNKAADGQPWLLQPGEAAMGCTNYLILGWNSGNDWKYNLTNLFQTAWNSFSAYRRSYTYKADGTVTTNEYVFPPAQAAYAPVDRHVPVVVRLPKGANSVTHYDLRAQGSWPNTGSSTVRIPRSWKIEGSADGITWDVLDCVISNAQENIVSGGGGHWFSNNKSTMGAGFGPYPSGVAGATRTGPVASVSVAPGATLAAATPLTTSSLAYDCATGAGTLTGVTLADDAQIVVTNMTAANFNQILPLTLDDAAAYAGKRFSVIVNGEYHRLWFAEISEEGLRVYKSGLRIIVR